MSEPPRSRRWFVVLAWITLILFGIFVGGITLVAATLPQIRKARHGSVPGPESPVLSQISPLLSPVGGGRGGRDSGLWPGEE